MSASTTMHAAYKHVRRRQRQAAKHTQTLAAKGRRAVEYEAEDSVLLWQPKQNNWRRNDTEEEGATVEKELRAPAPGKWRPKWTGPHVIVQKKDANTYSIRDVQTGFVCDSVHVDTLHPYNPWSRDEISTSPDLDRLTPWKTSTVMFKGELVAVALPGMHWAIGKLLEDPEEGQAMDFQWMSNYSDSHNKSHDVFETGWVRGDARSYYGTRRNGNPAYTAVTSSTVIWPSTRQVLLHGFRLTKGRTLTAPVRRELDRARKALLDDHHQ